LLLDLLTLILRRAALAGLEEWSSWRRRSRGDWNAIIDKNAPHGTSPMVDQADPMGLGGVS
jgi:hypothetical protein